MIVMLVCVIVRMCHAYLLLTLIKFGRLPLKFSGCLTQLGNLAGLRGVAHFVAKRVAFIGDDCGDIGIR